MDKRVYNYLIQESRRHSLSELKKRLLDAGHDLNVVNEAINAVKQQMQPRPVQRNNLPNISTQKTSMNAIAIKNPPMKKTVNPSLVSAKTKTPFASQKPMKQVEPMKAKPMKLNGKAKPMKLNGKAKPMKIDNVNGTAEYKKSKKWIWIFLGHGQRHCRRAFMSDSSS